MPEFFKSRKWLFASAALVVVILAIVVLTRSSGNNPEDNQAYLSPRTGASGNRVSAQQRPGKQPAPGQQAGKNGSSYQVPIPGSDRSKTFTVQSGVNDPFKRADGRTAHAADVSRNGTGNIDSGQGKRPQVGTPPDGPKPGGRPRPETDPDKVTPPPPPPKMVRRPGIAPVGISGKAVDPGKPPEIPEKPQPPAAGGTVIDEPVKPRLPDHPYRLNGVMDSRNGLYAVLTDDKGSYNVRQGDKLYDGSVVTSVTRNQVTLSKWGKTRALNM